MSNLLDTKILFDSSSNLFEFYLNKYMALDEASSKRSLDITNQINYLKMHFSILGALSNHICLHYKNTPYRDISNAELNKQINKETRNGIFLSIDDGYKQMIKKQFTSNLLFIYNQRKEEKS